LKYLENNRLNGSGSANNNNQSNSMNSGASQSIEEKINAQMNQQ
jgi:hypothetical protein